MLSASLARHTRHIGQMILKAANYALYDFESADWSIRK